MSDRPLTAKQQRFVAAYDGNATAACRDAGYAGSDNALAVMGRKLLTNGKVAAAIAAREAKRTDARIATREERQAFWSAVLRGEYTTVEDGKLCGADFGHRLKASELLGRSEADFVDTTRHQGHDGGPARAVFMTDAELMEKARG